jgi:ubiquinone/menaquinone biosynthesis C-methylase UbiE
MILRMIFFRQIFTFCLILTLFGCDSNDSQTPTVKPMPMKTPESPSVSTAENGTNDDFWTDSETQNRAIWQKPDMVINLLGDLNGKTVADIGAGTGYFAFRMASRAKRVIAIEIDQKLINVMDSVKVKLPKNQQIHFETRLGKTDNPQLKPAEVDAVTIVNTIGFIENRVDYLKNLRAGMSSGAILLIIDFKKNLPVGPEEKYKIAVPELESELRRAGFKPQSSDGKSLEYQYILIAKN